MEIDRGVARAFADANLLGSKPLTSYIRDNLDLVTGEFDLTVHAKEWGPGELFISKEGYESRIVTWDRTWVSDSDSPVPAMTRGRRVPVTDLERPTRERLMHFLDRPDRVMLSRDPGGYPDRMLDHFLNFRYAEGFPWLTHFFHRFDDRFMRYGYLTGPLEAEGDAQRAIGDQAFASPYNRLAVLLDGVDPASLPTSRSVVPDEVIVELARRTVGIIFGLPDNGHLFWWSPGWERFAHVDYTKTTDIPAEYLGWWPGTTG